MANWKFTDQYGTAYPALVNSILDVLIFDVPQGTSPVNPDGSFSAPLNLTATGKAMNMLKSLTGLTSIPMSGTVSTANATLTVSLASTNDAVITAAISKCIPLIGGSITKNAGVTIKNITPASATVEDEPAEDKFELPITINIGNSTGTVTTQIPMSEGLFSVRAEFDNFGISLNDLNFLVVGTPFATLFPTSLPTSYYNPATKLSLLSLELAFFLKTTPSLSVTVSNVTVSIGIVNIPLYPNRLFLNPLAVWVSVASPTNKPVATWGITGTIALYPYGKQTNPPTANPDFTFEMEMEMPTSSNPTFSVSGQYDNPYDLAVSQILCDLMDDGNFNTGIADSIILEKFEFYTAADTSTGTIDEFSVDVAMSSPIGLFATPGFGVKDFSISVSYIA
jgi:hypothetical protein